MVQHITELTRTLLECEYVSVIHVESEKDKLHLLSIAGTSKEQEEVCSTAIENLSLHEALDARSFLQLREGNVLQIAQTQPLLQVMSVSNMQRVMIAPMHVHEQFLGIVILHFAVGNQKYSLQEKKAIAEVVGVFVASLIEREHVANKQVAVGANMVPLGTADGQINNFLSLIGHELRTPLTAMKSNVWFATNLLTDALQHVQKEETALRNLVEDVRELLYRVDQLVGVQNRLVSELLDVSQLQVNKLDLQYKPHNLRTLVLQTTEKFSHTTNRVHVGRGDETSIPVLVDSERIGQVLNNYIMNALTYSALERLVEVSVQVQGHHARVWVHDAGLGLSPEEQEHVWKRFYRVPRVVAQANARGGLGLGLYLSKIIIEHHGGQVGVDSTVGEGSTFWFTLPLIEQADNT